LKKRIEYPWNEAFKQLNWMPFMSRIKYHSVLYIYKALNNLASTQSTNYFAYNSNRISARTGDHKKLILLKPNINFYINSLFYKGIQIYNVLSLFIRSI
jgi:hypothetical protein